MKYKKGFVSLMMLGYLMIFIIVYSAIMYQDQRALITTEHLKKLNLIYEQEKIFLKSLTNDEVIQNGKLISENYYLLVKEFDEYQMQILYNYTTSNIEKISRYKNNIVKLSH